MKKWLPPIFDRTINDVIFAKNKIKEWKMEDNPITIDLKGCLNVSDLNRVENNISFLAEMLIKFRYSLNISCKNWSATDVPTFQDMNRIINNMNSLISILPRRDEAPDIPENILKIEDINAIEKNLFLSKDSIDYMIKNFKKSNTFKSGENFFLPIK